MKSPEQFGSSEAEEKEKAKENLRDRLAALIRTISGKKHLKVVTEVDEQTRLREAMQGRDIDKQWFWQQKKDKKTGKVLEELVHLPEQMMEKSENFIRGASAHEAGHALITRLGDVVPDEVLQQLGFHGMLAALEERPTDQVVRDRYPGAGEWVDEVRRELLAEGEAAMKANKNIGYIPKFLQLCDLLVFEPHFQGNRTGIEPAVMEIYEKIRKNVEAVEHTLPFEGSSEKEVAEVCAERYKIAYKKIWPEVQKIVEKDQGSEELREMINKHMQDILEDLKEELRKELQQAIDEAVEKMADEAAAEQEKEEGGKGEPKAGEPEKGEEKENPSLPLPMDKFSDELNQALKKSFDKLSKEQKEALKKKAQKNLEKLEDDLVKDFSGKMEENPAETHEQHERREEQEGEQKENQEESEKREKDEQERIKKAMEEAEKRTKELETRKGPYDEAYKSVKDLDELLYRRLEEVFTPNIKSEVKLRSSGAKLNLPAVFRWEAEKAVGQPSQVKIFESVTMPEPKDYAVTLLVDLSGSMARGKIGETFKGVVLLSEVLNRLGVKFSVLGFQDQLLHFKDFDQKLSDKVRNKMGGMIYETIGTNPGGHNEPGNNDDGPCLAEASELLEDRSEREKFLIVLSDGLPAGSHSDEHDLVLAVESVIKNTDQKLLGVGLGAGTEHVQRFYPVSLPNVDVKNFASVFGNLLEDLLTNPGNYKSANK